MSISPISSSMMSMYAASSAVSGVTQKDYEYELIKQKLLALGVQPTGDKNIDKTRLEIAERMKESQESQNESSSKSSIPFDDIMNTLNITVTGDLDKDYDSTIDKLEHEITMASTDEEREYFEALKDEVETEYNDSKKNSISTAFSGATQIASMNRYLLGI